MTLARLFRFRLRTLLLLTASVVSLMLSAWSVWVRPYREQQAALKELSRLGASTNARAANAAGVGNAFGRGKEFCSRSLPSGMSVQQVTTTSHTCRSWCFSSHSILRNPG